LTAGGENARKEEWIGREGRRQVPRGVYVYRLDTPGFRSVKKAVVAR
jgi:hypothetical protein